MRTFAVALTVAASLSCSDLGPALPIRADDLTLYARVSPASVSLTEGVDTIIVRLHIKNHLHYPVIVVPESSSVANGDAFNGFGYRWRWTIERVDVPASGGERESMSLDRITIAPNWSSYSQHVIRPRDPIWGLPPGEYRVRGFIQGIALEPVSFVVRP